MKVTISDESLISEILHRSTISILDLNERLLEKYEMYDRWTTEEFEKYRACDDESKLSLYANYREHAGRKQAIENIIYELKGCLADTILNKKR